MTPVAPGPATRAWLPDALKALAALCIVWHHALLYGPLAEAAETLNPDLAGLLQQYGRYAVQVFLVIGGYLALQGLQRRRAPLGELLLQRHLRLALPFLAALALTLLAHALTAGWLPALLPEDLSAGNLLAHALLLHGVLGSESLSLGAWYVAIDFQLYALLALATLALPSRWLPTALLAGLLASAWGFNRFSGGDDWAPYFFAAYGLGALAALRPRWLPLAAAGVLLALCLDFRGRLLLALGVALLLARPWPPLSAAAALALRWLADRAYALFLLHYAVLLLGNALFLMLGAGREQGGLAWLLLFGCWLAALGLADVFHRQLERRLSAWRPAPRLLLLLPLLGGLLLAAR